MSQTLALYEKGIDPNLSGPEKFRHDLINTLIFC